MEEEIFKNIISLEKDGLKNNNIRSINKTKDGMYYISTNMNGVFFFDPNSINTITSNEGFMDYEVVNDIKVDNNGSIWVGCKYGLYKVENGIVVNYFNKENVQIKYASQFDTFIFINNKKTENQYIDINKLY